MYIYHYNSACVSEQRKSNTYDASDIYGCNTMSVNRT